MQAAVGRRLLVALIILAVTAPLVVLDATRVEASEAEATESRCSLSVWTPETNGVEVWGEAAVECTDVPGVDAVKLQSRLQERVFGYWTTRKTTYSYGRSDYLKSGVFIYICNGHGTNKWRTRATGYDSTEDSRSKSSPVAEITC